MALREEQLKHAQHSDAKAAHVKAKLARLENTDAETAETSIG